MYYVERTNVMKSHKTMSLIDENLNELNMVKDLMTLLSGHKKEEPDKFIYWASYFYCSIRYLVLILKSSYSSYLVRWCALSYNR